MTVSIPTGAPASASDAVERENTTGFVKLPGAVERALSAYRKAQWTYGKACASGGDGEMPDAVAEWQALRRAIAAALSPAVVPESVRRLSEAATGGEWYASGGTDIRAAFLEATGKAIGMTSPAGDGNGLNDRAFIVALVNWFRDLATPSGRADTPPAGGGVVEDALAEFQRRNGYHKPAIEELLTEFGELLLAKVAAAPEPAAGGGREIVRHLKSGGVYEVLGEAEAQVSLAGRVYVGGGTYVRARYLTDDCRLTVYRDPKTGKLWCRFTDEFRDGRFEPVPEARPILSAPSQAETAGGDGLSLAALHAANIARQAEWCPNQVPDLSFRGNELAGETGEACNVIKKLERERQGWRGSRASLADLAEELADVVICADLCAITAGIDLSAAVVAKFNATSEKQGLAARLPTPANAGAEGGQHADR